MEVNKGPNPDPTSIKNAVH